MKLCESVLYQGYKSFDPVLFANCEKRLGKAAFGENQNLYIERTHFFAVVVMLYLSILCPKSQTQLVKFQEFGLI